MNKYEIMYILTADSTEEARDTIVKKFEDLVAAAGGAVEKVEKMGLKRLAYPIKFKNDGYYVLMNFTANPDLPSEMERQMRISDEVIRFLVTRQD